jgi:hypothetical protein
MSFELLSGQLRCPTQTLFSIDGALQANAIVFNRIATHLGSSKLLYAIVLATAKVESANFSWTSRNPNSSAYGMYQLMAKTRRDILSSSPNGYNTLDHPNGQTYGMLSVIGYGIATIRRKGISPFVANVIARHSLRPVTPAIILALAVRFHYHSGLSLTPYPGHERDIENALVKFHSVLVPLLTILGFNERQA